MSSVQHRREPANPAGDPARSGMTRRDLLGATVTKGGPFAYGSYPDIGELYPKQADELDRTKRAAILEKMQPLVHERAIYAPIWQLGFINAVGPRVGESAFDLIAGSAYTAPFEDITIKA